MYVPYCQPLLERKVGGTTSCLLRCCFSLLLLCLASSASLCCCCCRCFKNKIKDRRYTKEKTCGASKQHKQRTTRASRVQAHDNCRMIATREGGHQWYGPCHTRTAARAPDRIPRLQPLATNDNGLHTQPAAQQCSAEHATAKSTWYYFYGEVLLLLLSTHLSGNIRTIWVLICIPKRSLHLRTEWYVQSQRPRIHRSYVLP